MGKQNGIGTFLIACVMHMNLAIGKKEVTSRILRSNSGHGHSKRLSPFTAFTGSLESSMEKGRYYRCQRLKPA